MKETLVELTSEQFCFCHMRCVQLDELHFRFKLPRTLVHDLGR